MDSLLESLGIGFVVMSFFGTVFGFIAFMRYLRYKETIELAKQGLIHPRHNSQARNDMSRTMRSGVLTFAIGLALTCGFLTIGFEEEAFFGPWLLPGFIPLAVGAALIYIGRTEQPDNPYDDDDDDRIPPHKIH